MTRLRSFVRALVLAILLLTGVHAQAQVGGGWLNAGLDGSYYANTGFSGQPVFQRRDVRLEFGSSNVASAAGSKSVTFAPLGATNWSAVWTGRLMPRFSEVYAFTTSTSGTLKVYIKPTSQGSFGAPLINQTAAGTTTVSYGSAFTANQAYDIRVEFTHASGPWGLTLHWSSPSTPDEAVDVTSITGFNGESNGFGGNVLNNVNPGVGINARFTPPNTLADGTGNAPVDANGDPAADFKTKTFYNLQAGTCLIQFNGQAAVGTQFFQYTDTMTSVNGSTNYGSFVPKGDPGVYNASTNTTTILLKTKGLFGGQSGSLYFGGTQRLGNGAADATGNAAGITHLIVYKPNPANPSSPSTTGQVFDPTEEYAVRRFTNLRWIYGMLDESTSWSARLLPNVGLIENTYVETNSGRGNNRKYCWEMLVMISNETGKDLYLTLPVIADNNYFTNLANLIRYGSNGINPYTSPTAAPVYPPLNPNLRVIFEMGNETWNSGGPYSQQSNVVYDTGLAAINSNTADGQAINYDHAGVSTGGAIDGGHIKARWWTQRLLNASNCFRAVFEPGNATTRMSRIRPIFEYQYTNSNSAYYPLQFIENYYGKADPASTFSGTAHPVSYYFWGGGAATYFGSSNQYGLQDPASTALFKNANFESNQIAASTNTSTDASWTFTAGSAGTAGIFHNVAKTNIVTSSLGGSTNTGRAVGFDFTVGSSDIALYQLGFFNKTATTAGSNRDLRVYRVAGTTYTQVAAANVDLKNKTAGTYVYDYFDSPVVLTAGQHYRFVAIVYDANNDYYDGATTINAPAGITVNESVSATFNDPNRKGDVTTWTWVNGVAGNHVFGPVDMIYSTVRNPVLGWTSDAANTAENPTGSLQAAYITGNGKFSQAVNFSVAGTYAVYFNCALPINNAGSPLKVYVDGVDVTPDATQSTNQTVANPGGFLPIGGYDRNTNASRWGLVHFYGNITEDAWCTLPFEVGINGSPLGTGTHTITFLGQGAAGTATQLDNLRIVSARAIYDSIPNTGAQNGAVASNGSYAQSIYAQESYAQAYGLNAFAYEAGIALGGDTFSDSLQYYVKHNTNSTFGALMTSKVVTWLDITARAGLKTNTLGTYESWDSNKPLSAVDADPNIIGFDSYNSHLPAEQDLGAVLPAQISTTAANVAASQNWDQNNARITATTGWVSVDILAPATGNYDFLATTGAGGTARLLLDGGTLLATGSSGSPLKNSTSALLTKGFHTVRVQSVSGAFTVSYIEVAKGGVAFAPTGVTATKSGSAINVAWSSASSGVTSFLVERSATATFSTGITSFSVPGSSTSYSDTSVTNGHTYYYRVRAITAAGQSAPSVWAAVTYKLISSISEQSTGTSYGYMPGAIATLNVGTLQYVDRTTSFTSVASGAVDLTGADFVQIGNNNKSDPAYRLTYTLSAPADVYLLMDTRNLASPGLPSGATDFTDTGVSVTVNAADHTMRVYKGSRAAGTYTIGAQLSNNTIYSLAALAAARSPLISSISEQSTGTSYGYMPGAIATLNVGTLQYVDRTITFTSVASGAVDLTGADFVQIGNNNKSDPAYRLTYTLSAPADVYLLMDTRNLASPGLPSGATDFTDTGVSVTVNAADHTMRVYKGSRAAGTYTIGAQLSNNTIYSLAALAAGLPRSSVITAPPWSATANGGRATTFSAAAALTVNDARTAATLTGAPAGLAGINIGSDATGAGTVHASGNWWIDGAGANGLSGTSDSFHFEQRAVQGEFVVVARLQNLTGVGPAPRGGLMVRDGTGADAKFVALSGTTAASGGYRLISRTATATASETTTGNIYNYPAGWMMIQRVNNVLRVFVSPDSFHYTEVTPTAGITWPQMSSVLNVGAFASSGSASASTEAVVSDYALDHGYVYIADETTSNAQTTFNQKVDVAYGSNGKFFYKYGVTGSLAFDDGTFGDPSDGAVKAGYYRLSSAGPAGYALVANEGQSYNFADQVVDVVYGAGSTFAYESGVTGPVIFNTTSFGDPAPGVNKAGYAISYADVDINAPTSAGSTVANTASGKLTVTGGGSGVERSGTTDQFHFFSRVAQTNKTLIVHIDSVQNSDAGAKAGVMFRTTDAANSAYVAVFQNPDRQVEMQWRDSTGAAAGWSGLAGGTASAKWLRLVKVGDTFTGFYATTTGRPAGSDWVQIGASHTTSTFSLSSYEAGLAVSAHNTSVTNTSVFSDLWIW